MKHPVVSCSVVLAAALLLSSCNTQPISMPGNLIGEAFEQRTASSVPPASSDVSSSASSASQPAQSPSKVDISGLRDGLVREEDGTGVTLTSEGIEYAIASSNLIAVPRVTPEIAAAIGEDPEYAEQGLLEPIEDSFHDEPLYRYMAFVDVKITNLKDTPQTPYVNTLSLCGDIQPYTAEFKEINPQREPCAVRYFSLGNPDSKAYCSITLQGGESVDCVVGFVIYKESFEKLPYVYYCLNPMGVYPPADNADFAEASVSFYEE